MAAEQLVPNKATKMIGGQSMGGWIGSPRPVGPSRQCALPPKITCRCCCSLSHFHGLGSVHVVTQIRSVGVRAVAQFRASPRRVAEGHSPPFPRVVPPLFAQSKQRKAKPIKTNGGGGQSNCAPVLDSTDPILSSSAGHSATVQRQLAYFAFLSWPGNVSIFFFFFPLAIAAGFVSCGQLQECRHWPKGGIPPFQTRHCRQIG